MADDVIDDMRRIAGRHYDASKVSLLLDEVHPGQHQDVPDPWYGPEPGYHEVYKMIDTAADSIIAKYGRPGTTNASTTAPIDQRATNASTAAPTGQQDSAAAKAKDQTSFSK